MATTDDRDPTERTLAALGVADRIDATVCADDGIAVKPAPDMVLHLCATLGVAPARTAVVGDTAADLRMARAAGAGLTVGVLTGVGGRADLEPLADAVIASVEELQAGRLTSRLSGARPFTGETERTAGFDARRHAVMTMPSMRPSANRSAPTAGEGRRFQALEGGFRTIDGPAAPDSLQVLPSSVEHEPRHGRRRRHRGVEVDPEASGCRHHRPDVPTAAIAVQERRRPCCWW